MGGRLKDKVCLVTGAGSGIGRATALAFAQEGAKVMVADINEGTGEQTVALIREEGGESYFVRVDTSKENEVCDMVKATVDRFGRLDCAVNGAGISGNAFVPIQDYPEESWNQVIAVNLTGVWYCMKHQIPQMLSQGAGSIVNIASIAGLKGLPNGSAYTAAKHGVVGITKVAALENATNNLRINAICPAFIETPLVMDGVLQAKNNPEMLAFVTDAQPMKRMGQPEEIAQAILWLCSEESSFVTGHALAVDGGMMA